MKLLDFALSGTALSFHVRVGGTVVERLSGVEVSGMKQTDDGIEFDVRFDALGVAIRLLELASAETIDVTIAANGGKL